MRMTKVAAATALALALAGCGGLGGPPVSCADDPRTGRISNAPEDGTRGASGASTTSNGTGSTADPTAPPCR